MNSLNWSFLFYKGYITNHGIFWHYLIISYWLVELHDDNPHVYLSKVLFILVQATFYSPNKIFAFSAALGELWLTSPRHDNLENLVCNCRGHYWIPFLRLRALFMTRLTLDHFNHCFNMSQTTAHSKVWNIKKTVVVTRSGTDHLPFFELLELLFTSFCFIMVLIGYLISSSTRPRGKVGILVRIWWKNLTSTLVINSSTIVL